MRATPRASRSQQHRRPVFDLEGRVRHHDPLDYEEKRPPIPSPCRSQIVGAGFSKDIQIGVTNVNEAPTDIALSNASVAENARHSPSSAS